VLRATQCQLSRLIDANCNHYGKAMQHPAKASSTLTVKHYECQLTVLRTIYSIQFLPHSATLTCVAIVSDQQVQLAFSLVHCTEVVVPEEHTERILLDFAVQSHKPMKTACKTSIARSIALIKQCMIDDHSMANQATTITNNSVGKPTH
jgi:hypothetical protein